MGINLQPPGPGSATALAAGLAFLGAGLTTNEGMGVLLIISGWAALGATLLIEWIHTSKK